MPRVVHFEIPAEDRQRAGRFYESVFGWDVVGLGTEAPYFLCRTGSGPGIDGGILAKQGPVQAVTNIIDVPSVDEFVAKITGFGGKVLRPKQAVPNVGWVAYCADTEGNSFGIIQSDPQAR
jgi:uncharacterized protein